MAQAFLSDRIVTADGIRAGALLVEDGLIRAICNVSELPPETTVIDYSRYAILPGLVDTHVHINEPGRTEWEGFRTATRAAAAGGYTLLVDMPLNCLPATTTVAALEAKRQAAAGQCLVDWAAWGGVVADNHQDILPLARAGVPGYKCFLVHPGCDGFTMVTRQQLEGALPFVAQSGLPLLTHAEVSEPIERATAKLANADWRRYATYLASRPDEAETSAIQMLIGLCRKYRFRLHIVHLSSAEALPYLRSARDDGLPITVETCPHYLHFAAEEIADGATLHKCAPPIREQDNRELLWRALGDGTIDMIVTDHSPCPVEMKELGSGRWDKAWGGIAGLSVALSVVHSDAIHRGFSLVDFIRWMSKSPALLAGMSQRAGELSAGREANFIIFDSEAHWTVTADDLHFRHAISPYVGEVLQGRVVTTYLRGATIFDDTGFAAMCSGREVRLC